MNSKIKNILVGFKPQFGNRDHIRAMEIIAKIKQRDALKAKKRRMNDEINEELMFLDEELSDEEKLLEYLLK